VTASIVAVVPLLVLISYPGGEPIWDAYFRSVPLGITVLFLVMIFPGVLLSLVGAAISPPDPRLDFWLDLLRFRKYLSPRVKGEPPASNGVWASFVTDRPMAPGWTLGVSGKCLVEFEEHFLSLGQPGKDIVLIEPKSVSRTRATTLELDTGRWNYGRVTLTFDSASDADKVEQEARKLLTEHDRSHYRFWQIPPFSPKTSRVNKLLTSLNRKLLDWKQPEPGQP
jgi:hypothetical protein